jgi:hypothetical protein
MAAGTAAGKISASKGESPSQAAKAAMDGVSASGVASNSTEMSALAGSTAAGIAGASESKSAAEVAEDTYNTVLSEGGSPANAAEAAGQAAGPAGAALSKSAAQVGEDTAKALSKLNASTGDVAKAAGSAAGIAGAAEGKSPAEVAKLITETVLKDNGSFDIVGEVEGKLAGHAAASEGKSLEESAQAARSAAKTAGGSDVAQTVAAESAKEAAMPASKTKDGDHAGKACKTSLATNSKAGDDSVKVTDGSCFAAGQVVYVGDEEAIVGKTDAASSLSSALLDVGKGIDKVTLTEALKHDHAKGSTMTYMPEEDGADEHDPQGDEEGAEKAPGEIRERPKKETAQEPIKSSPDGVWNFTQNEAEPTENLTLGVVKPLHYDPTHFRHRPINTTQQACVARLDRGATIGESDLEVSNTACFRVGDLLDIGGEQAEVKGKGNGSLLLKEPVKQDHAEGRVIKALIQPTPKAVSITADKVVTLSAFAEKGAKSIELHSTAGLTQGDTLIFPGGEYNKVASIGSVILTIPLQKAYPAGTTITIPAAPEAASPQGKKMPNSRGSATGWGCRDHDRLAWRLLQVSQKYRPSGRKSSKGRGWHKARRHADYRRCSLQGCLEGRNSGFGNDGCHCGCRCGRRRKSRRCQTSRSQGGREHRHSHRGITNAGFRSRAAGGNRRCCEAGSC